MLNVGRLGESCIVQKSHSVPKCQMLRCEDATEDELRVIGFGEKPPPSRDGRQGAASKLEIFYRDRWGGQGSNLRPTDYESAALTN